MKTTELSSWHELFASIADQPAGHHEEVAVTETAWRQLTGDAGSLRGHMFPLDGLRDWRARAVFGGAVSMGHVGTRHAVTIVHPDAISDFEQSKAYMHRLQDTLSATLPPMILGAKDEGPSA